MSEQTPTATEGAVTADPAVRVAYDAIVSAWQGARGTSAPLPPALASAEAYAEAVGAGMDVDTMLGGETPQSVAAAAEQAPGPVVEITWSPDDGDAALDQATFDAFTIEEYYAARVFFDGKEDGSPLTFAERIEARERWRAANAKGNEERARALAEKLAESDPEANARAAAAHFAASAEQLHPQALLEGAINHGLLGTHDSGDPADWRLTKRGEDVLTAAAQKRLSKVLAGIEAEDRLGYGFTVAGHRVTSRE